MKGLSPDPFNFFSRECKTTLAPPKILYWHFELLAGSEGHPGQPGQPGPQGEEYILYHVYIYPHTRSKIHTHSGFAFFFLPQTPFGHTE